MFYQDLDNFNYFVGIFIIELSTDQKYTDIGWVQDQQQFYLTQGHTCCRKPQVESTKSVQGLNKTAVVRETSLLYTLNFSIQNRLFTFPFDVFHSFVLQVWESGRCPLRLWHKYHMAYLNNENKPLVYSSITGNRSMSCWPVSRTVLQLIWILLLTLRYFVLIVLLLYSR